MLSESDATRLWQRLFRGQAITALTFSEAESVISQLSPESPVRLRLSQELEELRTIQQGKRSKRKG